MITTDRRRLAKVLASLRAYTGKAHHTHGLVRVSTTTDEREPPGLLLSCMNGRDFASALVEIEQDSRSADGEEVAVPLELMHQFVASAHGSIIEVGIGSKELSLVDWASVSDCGTRLPGRTSCRARLLGTDLETVPRVPVEVCDVDHMFARGAGDLCKSISAAILTAAPENSRYAIAGVRVEADGTVVATNGRAMQWRKANIETGSRVASDFAVLIPTPLALQVAKWTHVDLFSGPSHAYAVSESDGCVWTAGTTHIEGGFPPWRSVIPDAACTVAFEASHAILARAVKQAKTMADRDIPGVRFRINGGFVTISSSAATGEARVEVDATVVQSSAEAVEFMVSPDQLLDMIDASAKVLTIEPFRIGVIAPNKALMLSSGDNWSAVLMPMVLK